MRLKPNSIWPTELGSLDTPALDQYGSQSQKYPIKARQPVAIVTFSLISTSIRPSILFYVPIIARGWQAISFFGVVSHLGSETRPLGKLMAAERSCQTAGCLPPFRRLLLGVCHPHEWTTSRPYFAQRVKSARESGVRNAVCSSFPFFSFLFFFNNDYLLL